MNFCTIVSSNFVHYALNLRESLLCYNESVRIYILVSDFQEGLKERVETQFENTVLMFAEEICTDGLGKALSDKYAASFKNTFRWCMKPILLRYLMEEKGLDKIIYTDADIRFYSQYQFLFEGLDQHTMLLTPHWRPSDPHTDELQFFTQYTFGLYNAGFMGVNRQAIPALEWLAKTNLYICEVDPCRGQFLDQSHLNLLPIYFDDVHVLKHKGCNVAGWNVSECKRTLTADGQVTINHKWPIVFIHYSSHTVSSIESGIDPLLKPHLEEYNRRIGFFGEKLGVKSQPDTTGSPVVVSENDAVKPSSLFTRVRRFIRRRLISKLNM